eukprot:TRINITY_DN32581_c0_g1_i1.p1 TRINITY_DN32581_c0_g1~~TRINITY_DN32581_c0_g1_i1.p1  ORF type:complete len:575 (+),score=144.47 TRINITY_DN32581_c0_g1_i1:73-1797(+)
MGFTPAASEAQDSLLRFVAGLGLTHTARQDKPQRPPPPSRNVVSRPGDGDLVELIAGACARAGGSIPLANFFRMFPSEQRSTLQGRRLADVVGLFPSRLALHRMDDGGLTVSVVGDAEGDASADLSEAGAQSDTGVRAMRELERTVVAFMLEQGSAPVRFTYMSRAWSVRRKIRQVVSVTPVPTLVQQGLPLATALSHFYHFLLARPSVFVVAEEGEDDMTCPVPGPWRRAVVSLRDPRWYDDIGRGDAELLERAAMLMADVNPEKGTILTWLGQDNKIRKLLRGRALLPILQSSRLVRLWADGDTWRAVVTDAGKELADRAAERKRKRPERADESESEDTDDEKPAAARPEPPPVLVAVDGVSAVAKPWWATTEGLLHDISERDGRVYSISRLDKGTSGVLVYATSLEGERVMRAQYTERSVQKDYLCLCVGCPSRTQGEVRLRLQMSDGAGCCRQRVSRDGQEAATRYRVLRVYEREGDLYSLVHCEPLTGRTHQIRAHMAAIGHALVGDAKYGRQGATKKQRTWVQRLFLHCRRVSAVDVSGDRFEVVCPLAPELESLLSKLTPTDIVAQD